MVRLYVGNLDFSMTEDYIRELLGKYGDIESVAMVCDKKTNNFRGFCFVNMEDDCALKAVEDLDGRSFAGRKLEVIAANLKKRRSKKTDKSSEKSENDFSYKETFREDYDYNVDYSDNLEFDNAINIGDSEIIESSETITMEYDSSNDYPLEEREKDFYKDTYNGRFNNSRNNYGSYKKDFKSKSNFSNSSKKPNYNQDSRDYSDSKYNKDNFRKDGRFNQKQDGYKKSYKPNYDNFGNSKYDNDNFGNIKDEFRRPRKLSTYQSRDIEYKNSLKNNNYSAINREYNSRSDMTYSGYNSNYNSGSSLQHKPKYYKDSNGYNSADDFTKNKSYYDKNNQNRNNNRKFNKPTNGRSSSRSSFRGNYNSYDKY